MRKSLAAAMAAITFGGAVAATAAPAEARDYRHRGDYYGGRRHHNNNDAGVAIAAGVVGLALGAAIAGSNNNSGGYYNRGYYNQPPAYGYGRGHRGYDGGYAYGYAPRYRICQSRERVYDPYIDRSVVIRREYAC
jgi:hypothetical protein